MTDAISNKHENPNPGEKLELMPATAVNEVHREMGNHNFNAGTADATQKLVHNQMLPGTVLTDEIRNAPHTLDDHKLNSHHNFKPGEGYEGTFPIDHSDEGDNNAGGGGGAGAGCKPEDKHDFIPGKPYEGQYGVDHSDEGGGGGEGGINKPVPPLPKLDLHNVRPTPSRTY